MQTLMIGLAIAWLSFANAATHSAHQMAPGAEQAARWRTQAESINTRAMARAQALIAELDQVLAANGGSGTGQATRLAAISQRYQPDFDRLADEQSRLFREAFGTSGTDADRARAEATLTMLRTVPTTLAEGKARTLAPAEIAELDAAFARQHLALEAHSCRLSFGVSGRPANLEPRYEGVLQRCRDTQQRDQNDPLPLAEAEASIARLRRD